MRQHPSTSFWLAFALLSVALLVISMDPKLIPFDEGFMLYGAERFAHGELPYRDFWVLYGPGEFAVLALLFKLLGVTALVGRLFYVATMFSLVTVTAVLGLLMHGRRRYIVAVALISILWVAGCSPSLLYPVFPALLLAMVTMLFMVLLWKQGNLRYAPAAGISAGLLLLVRHDVAFWTTVALLLGEVYFCLRTSPSRSSACKRILRDIALYTAGFALIVAAAWVMVFRHIPLAAVYDQLFFYQAHIYKAVRGLPLPSPLHLPPAPPSTLATRFHLEWWNRLRVFLRLSGIYLPCIVLLAALVCFADRKWRQSLLPWQAATLVALMVSVAAMPISGFIRPDQTHQIVGGLPALLLGSVLLAARRSLGRPGQWAARVVLVAAALTFGIVALRGAWFAASFVRGAFSPQRPLSPWRLCRPVAGLERARCFYITPDETAATLFIEHHTSPGDRIFSSGTRTDQTNINDALIYFLAGRDTSGKWEEFEPGVGNTVPVQQELIRDFNKDHVRYIVQDSSSNFDDEHNLSSLSSHVYLLDNYIAANYRQAATFGTKKILERSTPFSSSF